MEQKNLSIGLISHRCIQMDATKIKLQELQSILVWMKINMSMDEIECILANLIYSKYIRGYLSHEAGYLVIAKNDPFPPVSS